MMRPATDDGTTMMMTTLKLRLRLRLTLRLRLLMMMMLVKLHTHIRTKTHKPMAGLLKYAMIEQMSSTLPPSQSKRSRPAGLRSQT